MSGAELGQTRDPRALIPGDPAALHAHAAELTSQGDTLLQVGGSLKRINTFEAWSGQAADAFRDKFTPHPGQWLTAGDSHHAAAAPVTRYAETLSWGQGQATTAVQQWDQAQAATESAVNQYNQAAARGVQQAAFLDPGAARRANAQATLARAREQVAGAGDSAARAVMSAANAAPQQSMLASIGTLAEEAGASVVNSAASFGNALLNQPLDIAAIAGGGLLTVASATGEVAGAILDVVPGGALAGVPLGVVSAAGISGGVGLMGAGFADAAHHAATDDRVEPITVGMARRKDDNDHSRPSGFRKGVRDKVIGNNSKDTDGAPVDPNTGDKLGPKWDMGHRPGKEFWRQKQEADEQGTSRKDWLDQHNDPNNYHAEDPSSNRSHKYEDKSGK